jgi:CRISPR/Cas system-associated exonuclease Cas4 (RecB family)
MAIEKVIDIKIQGNADEAVGSLRSQLRQAQADVAALSDKFGATSQQAIEAAKRAGELKDRIGDAKALTDAFNPDAKFKALSSSLAGVAGGFAAVQGGMALFGKQSEDVEKTLLKVQSAMALSQGLQGLGEARDSFKQLGGVAVDAFKSIKTAIGSTGIGLLVVALGTIYAYWDDIKAAVSGVSEEQKKLNAASQKNVDLETEKLKTIGNQDNILKLQGKSEKEILDIKIKQTNEAIAANKINQENQIVNTKLAVEGAKRNYEMLKSYLDFISIPQRYLYETAAKSINSIIDLINKIPGVKITAKIDEAFGDKATDYISKLGFDPEQVKAEGDKTVKASKETIDKLLNDRAGYILSKQAIDKKNAEQQYDAYKTRLADDLKNEELSFDEKRKLIKKYNKLTQDDRTEFLKLVQTQEDEAKKKDAEALKAALQAQRDATLSNELEITKAIGDAQDKNAEAFMTQSEIEERAVNDKYFRLIELAKQQKKDTLDLEIAQANEINDIRVKSDEADRKTKQENADATIELAKKEAAAKEALMAKTANVLARGADLLGKNTAAGKAMSIAAATINTYQGITAELATKTVTPFEIGLKIANVALIAATGLKAVKDIVAVKVPGGGGGAAPSMSGAGAGGGAAPQFNVVGNSGVNQLAGIMATNEQTPVKAYVVPSDVTTGQSLDRNIIRNASLG